MLNSRYRLIIQSAESNIKEIRLKKSVPICYKNCNLDLRLKNSKEKNLPVQQGPEIPLSNQTQDKKIKTLFKRINKKL